MIKILMSTLTSCECRLSTAPAGVAHLCMQEPDTAEQAVEKNQVEIHNRLLNAINGVCFVCIT